MGPPWNLRRTLPLVIFVALGLAACASGTSDSTQSGSQSSGTQLPSESQVQQGEVPVDEGEVDPNTPRNCGMVKGKFVVRAVPSMSCAEVLSASERILNGEASSEWSCLFIGDEQHRFCNEGEPATYSTSPLFIEERG
jgi:hypothetical protein